MFWGIFVSLKHSFTLFYSLSVEMCVIKIKVYTIRDSPMVFEDSIQVLLSFYSHKLIASKC